MELFQTIKVAKNPILGSDSEKPFNPTRKLKTEAVNWEWTLHQTACNKMKSYWGKPEIDTFTPKQSHKLPNNIDKASKCNPKVLVLANSLRVAMHTSCSSWKLRQEQWQWKYPKRL